jgi:fatty acid desaturase
MNKKHILLFLFPTLQVIFFVLALFFMQSEFLLSVIYLFFSIIFLNFSLHISVHYHVHFKYKNTFLNFIIDCIYSVLLALPFHFYKMQHFNHHRYNNLINDFTSTWKKEGAEIKSRNFIDYSFFWIFRRLSFKKMKALALNDGDFKIEWISKIRIELLFIFCTYSILVLINPFFIIYYICMFYIGWSFIAMHNFGQHLPIRYGDTLAYSFYNKFYNFIFFNNGLHYEHHNNPQKDYWELKSENALQNKLPHLIDGFLINYKKDK